MDHLFFFTDNLTNLKRCGSFSMGSRGLFIFTALCLLQLCLARHHQFYQWSNPIERLPLGDRRRQAPPPGYHPEFGTCGSGTTCENACGENWITCKSSTSLSLFCYNKVDLNQTCCGNNSGRQYHCTSCTCDETESLLTFSQGLATTATTVPGIRLAGKSGAVRT